MPYIPQIGRVGLENGRAPVSAGELNYAVTLLVDAYMWRTGRPNYTQINEAIGVLECAKLELYRRVAAPFEDMKEEENGDVYTS